MNSEPTIPPIQLERQLPVLDKGYVRLVDHMGNDLSVVNAARVSYDKESPEFDERDSRLLNFLINEGHMSPLRHAAATFEIYAPLMVARQWWKYAVGSTHADDQNGWNESSRRYITENEEFYFPLEWRKAPENSKQGSGGNYSQSESEQFHRALKMHTDYCEMAYQTALERGIAPELARLFLPANALYVRWRWTVSLAALIHFLQQRLEHDAQYEIQQYAQAINNITRPLYPNIFTKVFGDL